VGILLCAGTARAKDDVLFEKDAAKQKDLIENNFHKCADLLSENAIGKTRDLLDLINHRLEGLKKDMSREERDNYKQRIDRVKAVVTQKEDSLVNRNLEILQRDGMEAAIDFMRNVLEPLRVSRDRVKQVDEAIVAAAPLQKTPEEKARDKARELLDKGVRPEGMDDELVRAAARRILQQRADSVRAVQDSIREAQEEKARLDRLEQERQEAERLKREEEERKRRENELARMEKARVDSMERAKRDMERERLRVEKERQRREKSQLDSLKTAQKEQQRQAKLEQKKKDEFDRQREQAIRDSIVAASEAERQRMEELERKRVERLKEEERQRQAMLTQQEAERQRKAAELAERERQIRIAEQKRIEEERAAALQREREERARLEELERQRQARIDAQRREQERLAAVEEKRRQEEERRAEQQRRQQEQAQRERQEQLEARRQEGEARELSARAEQERRERERIEAEKRRRRQEADGRVSALSAPPQYTPSAAPPAPAPSSSLPIGESPRSYQPKAVSKYEARTQQAVSEIYSLLEQDRPLDAYTTFQRARQDIASSTSPEIYSTLEMTVMEAYYEAQRQKQAGQTQYTGAPTYETYEPKPTQTEQSARYQAARIEGLLRQNKVKAAYDTFKRVKADLRKYLDRDTYKRLEEKVETAYKILDR